MNPSVSQCIFFYAYISTMWLYLCSVFKEMRTETLPIVGGTQSGDLHKGFHLMVTHQITQLPLATVQCRKKEAGSWVGSCGPRKFTSKHASILYAVLCHLLSGLFTKEHLCFFWFCFCFFVGGGGCWPF